MGIGVPNITTLTMPQEIAYRRWMDNNGISNKTGWNVDDNYTGTDYDYRGFFKKYGASGLTTSGKNGVHFTDEFKLPNHESFSEESIYASPFDKRGYGYWDGEGDNAVLKSFGSGNTIYPPQNTVF